MGGARLRTGQSHGAGSAGGGEVRQPAQSQRVEPEVLIGPLDRLIGSIVAGIVAGAAMYAALAVVAVSQGRGLDYPMRAVLAMMSGRRVLPDHPVGSVKADLFLDVIVGPLWFLAPALFTALAVNWWLGVRTRRGDHLVRPTPSTVLAPALLVTSVLFVVLVLLLGFREAPRAVQSVSTGYGVRQLGLAGWLLAHAVYVCALVFMVGYASRAFAWARQRRTVHTARGETPRLPPPREATTSARRPTSAQGPGDAGHGVGRHRGAPDR